MSQPSYAARLAGIFTLFVPALPLACSDAPVESDDAALEAKTITVTTTAANGLEAAMNVSARVTKFACVDLYERSATRSIGCERDAERLEILHRGDRAIAIYRKDGLATAKPVFYECTQPTKGELPAGMTCAPKSPVSRAHGAGLASAFDSDVEGLRIPNAHKLSWYVFRGMAPVSADDYGDLEAKHIDRVLIFKKPSAKGDEIETEQAELTARGIESINIPFVWKDLPSFKETCEMTIDALAYLRAASAEKHHVYFHCSVGEDRTGYLAGLHRLLEKKTDRQSPRKVFDEELCDHGFGTGNPVKPFVGVAASVNADLLPAYQKMAVLIQEGKLDALDKKACVEPALPEGAESEVCTTSALFEL